MSVTNTATHISIYGKSDDVRANATCTRKRRSISKRVPVKCTHLRICVTRARRPLQHDLMLFRHGLYLSYFLRNITHEYTTTSYIAGTTSSYVMYKHNAYCKICYGHCRKFVVDASCINDVTITFKLACRIMYMKYTLNFMRIISEISCFFYRG